MQSGDYEDVEDLEQKLESYKRITLDTCTASIHACSLSFTHFHNRLKYIVFALQSSSWSSMRTTREILVSYLYILNQLSKLSCVFPLYIIFKLIITTLFSLLLHPFLPDIMELKRMMEKLGQAKTHLELKKMIAEVDTNNSGLSFHFRSA